MFLSSTFLSLPEITFYYLYKSCNTTTATSKTKMDPYIHMNIIVILIYFIKGYIVIERSAE